MIVTRFAPSPTGRLHLGHVFSAWQAWQHARDVKGRFLLRIEDIDAGRCRPEFEAAIIEDLAWLGLEGFGEPRRQSEHLGEHQDALSRLQEMGVVYPCFCTRRQVAAELAASATAPHGPLGAVYSGACRRLPAAERRARMASEPHAWRLDMAAAQARVGPLAWREQGQGAITVNPLPCGDVVLARKDTPTSYHLAVVHDDHAQGVNWATRGRDLFHATHVHRVLQALLGYEAPVYAHHRLLLDNEGKRLAKRNEALTVATLRVAGHSAAAVIAMAQGWKHRA